MERSGFIPRGETAYPIAGNVNSTEFYFVLLPKVTMLALSAAIEPLRIANQIAEQELFRWFTVSLDGETIECSNGIHVSANMSIAEVPRRASAFICSGTEPEETLNAKIVHWSRRHIAFGGSIGGICTGAFTLAEAGLLEGRKFTLHWENQASFTERFHSLVPSPNLFENDAGVMTCGGGIAGVDMMLSLIEEKHGRDLAIVVSDMCIHQRSHSQHTSQMTATTAAIGSRNQKLLSAVELMEKNIENPLPLKKIASLSGVSMRQLERLFNKYTDETPGSYYVRLRITKGRALLTSTSLPVTEIAVAVGFESGTTFAKRFKEHFGASPFRYRQKWKQ